MCSLDREPVINGRRDFLGPAAGVSRRDRSLRCHFTTRVRPGDLSWGSARSRLDSHASTTKLPSLFQGSSPESILLEPTTASSETGRGQDRNVLGVAGAAPSSEASSCRLGLPPEATFFSPRSRLSRRADQIGSISRDSALRDVSEHASRRSRRTNRSWSIRDVPNVPPLGSDTPLGAASTEGREAPDASLGPDNAVRTRSIQVIGTGLRQISSYSPHSRHGMQF